MISICLFIVAGLSVIGILIAIARIGKPRPPITPASAVVLVICGAAETALFIAAGIRLR